MTSWKAVALLAAVDLVGAALIAAGAWVYTDLRGVLEQSQKPDPFVHAVIATRDLPAGAAFAGEDLSAVRVHPDWITDETFNIGEEVVDELTTRPILANTFVGGPDLARAMPEHLQVGVSEGHRMMRIELPPFILQRNPKARVDLGLVPGNCRIVGGLNWDLVRDGTEAVYVPKSEVLTVMSALARGDLQPMMTGSKGADIPPCD